MCEVDYNCYGFDKDQCWHCEDYSNYDPKNKNILCERQKRRRAERKQAKKELKQTDASKRGRMSKKKGYRGENELVHEFEHINIPAKRQPLSGSLKGSLGADIIIDLYGEKLKVESKLRADGFKEDYKFLEQDGADLIVKKADRKPRLVTMTWDRFVWLLSKERGA